MNNELYDYINKKKQSVVKQYDMLLERIQLSKNPKSAIALMCDEEFVVHDAQYPISELLYLMSDFVDEYYKDNELFQDCTKEITDEYITYATEKYSIQFSAPFRYSSEIIVRYHAECDASIFPCTSRNLGYCIQNERRIDRLLSP